MVEIEYWEMILRDILGDHDVELPAETVAAMAKDLDYCVDAKSELTGAYYQAIQKIQGSRWH
jgi:hypothetical protein